MTKRSRTLRGSALRAPIEALGRYVVFLAQWVRKPLQTASIVPSSDDLAKKIVEGLIPGQGRVIELGGGTGAFTRAILKRGIAPIDLEVIELNPVFAKSLRERFPQVRVIEVNATQVSGAVSGVAGAYQAVVSGLPLLTIKPADQRAILREAFSLLGPKGAFYQFTYGTKCPVHPDVLGELGLMCTHARNSWSNFPPARIYRIERAA